MTEVLERTEPAPEAAREAAGAAASLGQRRMSSRLRADVRLARRQVWRTRGSSLLVLLLVALPVTGMVASAIVWQSHIATREQEVTYELGDTQARIEIVGGEDPSRTQSVDSTWDWEIDTDAQGNPIHPEKLAPTSPEGFVPADARLFEVREYGAVRARTADGLAAVNAQSGDVWDGAFQGRYVAIAGEVPTRPDEAMATPGMLERLGVDIGDTVTLTDTGDRFTLTGTLRRADMRSSDQWLFLPESASDLVDSQPIWFAADWQPTLDELTEMNTAGFIVYARDLVLSPPPGASVFEWRSDGQQAWAMIWMGLIVATFTGYLVVLLAGAAFAVAARRQQRSLAVAASVGATRADVFRIVVLQGTVLGLVGGLLGAGVGIGLAAAFIAVTDEGAVNSFWGVWGFNIPWAMIIGIVAFAVIVGTISAIAPARAATRGDVLGALRGARRPVTLNTRRPLWGLALIVGGFASSIAGALTLLALDAQQTVSYDHPLRLVAGVAIVIGPIIFQIGVLMAGHWIITMVARGLSRISLPARIASRDAAANPSRVVPAFSAIAACVFIASFAMSSVAISNASSIRNYYWSSPLGSVVVEAWGDPARVEIAWERALALAEDARPDRIIEQHQAVYPMWGAEGAAKPAPDARAYSVAAQAVPWCDGCGSKLGLMDGDFRIVAPDDLEAMLDLDLTQAELAAYRDGSAFAAGEGWVDAEGRVVFTVWSEQTQQAYIEAQNEYYALTEEPSASELEAGLPDPDETIAVPAFTRTDGKSDYPGVLIAPETAARLGMPTMPSRLLLLFDEIQTDAVYDRISFAAENAALGDSGIWAYAERGPQPADPWLWLIAGATVVLVIGAGAVCLGLARFERRPDDATLTAIGGSRGMRRRINAWQAVVIVGIGSVVGTIAGQIPMWGVAETSFDLEFWSDAPWLWLAILALGLPLMVMAVSWLVSPRHPDLTRRTAIA